MLGVHADDPHHGFAVNHLALRTHWFNRRSYFHSFLVILPRVRSWGVNTTSTRSPGNSRTKFLAFPALGCASTKSPFSSYGLVSTHGPFSVTATQCSKC